MGIKKLRVLITGSSGEIGTNLGLKLLATGHEVFGVDVRPNPWTDRIATIIQDLSLQYPGHAQGVGNIVYPDRLDAVVHLAAHAKVHELVKSPRKSFENVAMVFNILEFCRLNNLPVIYSSSREVYGDIHRYITDENQTNIYFTESPYSASKISGEAFVYSYARCYGLKYIVFRFSNVYGRYDNDLKRMERVMPLFIGKIGRGEPIIVYGEHKTLDFTYIDDCVQGIVAGIKLITGGGEVKHTINLAYGQGNTLVELARIIGAALGKDPKMTIEKSKIGEVTHYIADISKAREILGYEPKTDLKTGVRKAIEWAREWEKKISKL
ncbi:MAG: NAD-dependent epimerase/dehydratase family protein [Planctomycetes bacterium]|jgi:UDP-glucose 4-epimerase|nr:NAD-dependent epimerase/dehydratase family protein [Planctomycetota bacterium]